LLECGSLAHGFLRLRCGECGHDKLLAFSFKRRGSCLSCGAHRMSKTAVHLVDHVIPRVTMLQRVPLCESDRQLQGGEIRTAGVASGSYRQFVLLPSGRWGGANRLGHGQGREYVALWSLEPGRDSLAG
jgi:Transposase zinc-binding domain